MVFGWKALLSVFSIFDCPDELLKCNVQSCGSTADNVDIAIGVLNPSLFSLHSTSMQQVFYRIGTMEFDLHIESMVGCCIYITILLRQSFVRVLLSTAKMPYLLTIKKNYGE